jgi:hypothetical protein
MNMKLSTPIISFASAIMFLGVAISFYFHLNAELMQTLIFFLMGMSCGIFFVKGVQEVSELSKKNAQE